MPPFTPKSVPSGPVFGPDGLVLNAQQIAAKEVLRRINNLVTDGYPIYRPSYADVQFLMACTYGISTRHALSPAQMKCLEILEKKAAAKIEVCRKQQEATSANNAALNPVPVPVPAASAAVPVPVQNVPVPVPAPVARAATPKPAVQKPKAKPTFIDDEEAELDRLEALEAGLDPDADDFIDDSLPSVEV